VRTAFINAVCRAAAKDPRLWLLTADLGYSVLEAFANAFPDRFINVGVAEQNLVGVAAGLALSGKKVVTYSIVNFTTLRCLEQIRNDICYHGADVKLVGVGGGYVYGTQGHTHHGIEDLSVIGSLPDIDVVAPADAIEARLAAGAVLSTTRPAYVRLGKAGEPAVHGTDPPFKRGRVIRLREGRDALILALGGLVDEACGAADELHRRGRSVAVWSCPWLRPFDEDAVRAAARSFPIILTAEEAVETGGLGAVVARVIAGLGGGRARLVVAAVPATRGPAAISLSSARARHRLDAKGLADRISEAIAG
jgi:transketolase